MLEVSQVCGPTSLRLQRLEVGSRDGLDKFLERRRQPERVLASLNHDPCCLQFPDRLPHRLGGGQQLADASFGQAGLRQLQYAGRKKVGVDVEPAVAVEVHVDGFALPGETAADAVEPIGPAREARHASLLRYGTA